MNSTHADALVYLVNFVKHNPQILEALYGSDPDTAQLQQEVQDAQAWALREHRKPMRDDCWPKKNQFGVFDPGVRTNSYGEPTGAVPYQQVAYIRYFRHVDQMSDLGFLVLEMQDGSHRLGSHVDTWE